MARKPDLSSHNLPLLKKYCKDNGLKLEWKNQSQGHAVVYNQDTEAYIWIQRMVTGVRKRNGAEMSKTLYDAPRNYLFSKKFLDHLLFNGVKTTSHKTKQGIKVTRIPAGVN